MYLDKPLAGHNLMQAIARVNRVFGDKPGGLVVDFLGVFDDLRDALQTYAREVGEDRVPVRQIQDEALPVMQREFERLQGFGEANRLDPEYIERGYEQSVSGDAATNLVPHRPRCDRCGTRVGRGRQTQGGASRLRRRRLPGLWSVTTSW